jgi:hypothetical protein
MSRAPNLEGEIAVGWGFGSLPETFTVKKFAVVKDTAIAISNPFPRRKRR